MSRLHSMVAHMLGQRAACPHLSGVTQILGLSARQRDHPGACLLCDAGLLGAMIGVLESSARPNCQSTIDPLGHTLSSHVKSARNLSDSLAGVIAREDLRPLDLAKRSCRRSAQVLEPFQFIGFHCELRSFG